MKHFFRLRLWVDPGGSRKHEEWIAGTLAEVQEHLRRDLESGQGAYHALWYGEHMLLECWEGPRLAASIDLHPYITLELVGVGAMPLSSEPASTAALDDDAEEDNPFDDEGLWERVDEGTVPVVAHVAWEQMPLPQLAGVPLTPGEAAEIHEPGLKPYPMHYGFHDMWG